MNIYCFGTGSRGNCYLINSGNIAFLLDAGVNMKELYKKVNINKLDFCFISHDHKDHSLNRDKLANRGLFIVDGTISQDFIKNRIHSDSDWYTTFRVSHGSAICSGIIVRTSEDLILYITDFNLCKYDLSKFKFTHIIVECNYQESKITDEMARSDFKISRQINTHMGLDGLEIFLNRLNLSNTKEIIICHQSTDQRIFDQKEAMYRLYANYKKPVGCCLPLGGIEWLGKEDFNYE